MSLVHAIEVLAAGFAAGTINVVVGSGTLITFPVLLAIGYSPLTANVSNTIGLVPGSVAGAVGYRDRLRGRWREVGRFMVASGLGGLVGGVALLTLPEGAFEVIVPVLVALAVVLVAGQPWLSKRLAGAERVRTAGPLLIGLIFATGVYGGYFGAAQGVLLLGIMGLLLSDDLQEINGIKNVLAGLVNAVSALLFILFADVAWGPAVLIALGATAGGTLGARIAKRLPPPALRGVVVVVGLTAFAQLVL